MPLKPLMVSSRDTNLPGEPVKTSATKNGCDRKRWMITHGRRNTTQKCGHFGTGLRKAEDVINKEQNIFAFFIAEIFGHRQTRQSDTGTRAWRFVHLAIDQGYF